MDNFIILGAGLSSIGFYNGVKRGVVYESKDKAGGHIKSVKIGNYFFDQGAHICHSKNSYWNKLINSDSETINKIKGNVMNYKDGDIFGYPVQNNLFELDKKTRIKSLKSLIEKKDLKNITNYKDWLIFQYGSYLTDKFYTPFTHKYWRTSPDKLSIDWLKGRLIPVDLNKIIDGAFEKPVNSQAVFNDFKYPKYGGFNAFFNQLIKEIPVKLNMKATNIDLINKKIQFNDDIKMDFDKIVSSIPLNELINIIEDVPNKVLTAANNLLYLNLIQINIVLKKTDKKFNNIHWFYVYDENIDISRITIISNVSGYKKNNEVVIQAEIFRRSDEIYDRDELYQKGISDILKIFNTQIDDIVNDRMTFVKYSYVVSDLNKSKNLDIINNFLKKTPISSIGLYGRWNYIWSDIAYMNGYKLGKAYE